MLSGWINGGTRACAEKPRDKRKAEWPFCYNYLFCALTLIIVEMVAPFSQLTNLGCQRFLPAWIYSFCTDQKNASSSKVSSVLQLEENCGVFSIS